MLNKIFGKTKDGKKEVAGEYNIFLKPDPDFKPFPGPYGMIASQQQAFSEKLGAWVAQNFARLHGKFESAGYKPSSGNAHPCATIVCTQDVVEEVKQAFSSEIDKVEKNTVKVGPVVFRRRF